MYDPVTPDLIMHADCETAIAHVVSRLNRDGLHVVRSAEVPIAGFASGDPACLHALPMRPVAWLTVLTVFGRESFPVSLMVRQCHGPQTEFTFMAAESGPNLYDAQHRPGLEDEVRRALTSLAHRWN